MVIAISAPLLPNQKKTVLQNRPIHWRTLYIVMSSYNLTFTIHQAFNVILKAVWITLPISTWIFTHFFVKSVHIAQLMDSLLFSISTTWRWPSTSSQKTT